MRTVPMVEERLGKDRQSPLRAEQDEYGDHFTSLLFWLGDLPVSRQHPLNKAERSEASRVERSPLEL